MSLGALRSFRSRLTAIVASSGVAFALLIGTSQWLGMRVERQLKAIQDEYVPKVDLQPALLVHFERIQRTFEDAVASHDSGVLDGTPALMEAFQRRLDAAGTAIRTADRAALHQALIDYRAAADSVSRRLIAGEPGEALVDAMTAMQATQARFLNLLRTTTEFDPHDLVDAFAATRRAEATAAAYRLGISMVCLVSVLVLSAGLGRRLVVSVENLTKGFDRLGAGDFRIRVRAVTRDELGNLAVRANEMAARLERLQAERAKAEAMFRAVLESAPDAMVIIDAEEHIFLVSAETEKMFGYSRDELFGKPVGLLLPERSREKGAPSLVRKGPTSASGTELVGCRKDGSEFPMEVRVNPIETTDGALVSSSIRDITERKRAEQALALANRELESFSYSVAHDLRAPLRSIQGFSQALLEECAGELGDAGRDYLGRVTASAVRMGQLIDSLLVLSRVSQVEITPTSVNLSQIAQSIVGQLRANEPNRVVEFVAPESIVTQGDAALLRSLLDNLIGNAWKFTAKTERGRIVLGLDQKAGERIYYVKDNGVGFDMAYGSKLFAPFQRLHAASEFPGTGVGLATVQRIVRRHGGRIWAESAKNQGAVFYFTLPGGTLS